MRLLRTLALLAFVLLAAGTLAAGQTATGEVNGTVTDPNGAVLSAATVTL
jgi:hypothetical protein